MRLKDIFGFLLPEDRKFFPLFSKAADNLVFASELLIKLVREPDQEQRMDYIRQIKVAELVGDDFTRKLLSELDGTFITPIDREDIHELINKLDDIVDYVYSASTKINFYRISTFPEEFIRIADLIHASCKEIHKVLGSIRVAGDFKKHVLSNENIREYEGQVDDIYQEYLSKLFDQEVNAIDLIRKRDILSSMEKAIDKCDDVGNIFASLIIKLG